MKKLFAILLAAVPLLSGCGLRSIPMAKNAAEAALAEISNQYKRRLDLIPALVETVKGYAKHEKEVLTAVTEARAKATAMTIDPSNATPAQISAYANSQGDLSRALGRLLVAAENYPNLKADGSFRDLQAQLEGTENRIAIARRRYIEAIQDFNNQVTVFPTNLTNLIFFRHAKLPQWDMDPEEKKQAEKAPAVRF